MICLLLPFVSHFSRPYEYSDVPIFFTFRVPIVFKDNWAQIAASHLKENDLVYVSGKLTCDGPPFKLADGEANIQACSYCSYLFLLFCSLLISLGRQMSHAFSANIFVIRLIFGTHFVLEKSPKCPLTLTSV